VFRSRRTAATTPAFSRIEKPGIITETSQAKSGRYILV
jgi:hypothetical protein